MRKQDMGTLVFLFYSLKVPSVGYDNIILWCQEECRNSIGTRMFLLDLLKQDVGTLVFLVYLLKVPNVGYDMVVKRNVGTASESVFAIFAQAGCQNPNAFAMFAQSA